MTSHSVSGVKYGYSPKNIMMGIIRTVINIIKISKSEGGQPRDCWEYFRVCDEGGNEK